MKLHTRYARHGSWAVWRLLVSTKICRDRETAMKLVSDGEVEVDFGWTVDSTSYVPIGIGFLPLKVRDMYFHIFGVSPDHKSYAALPHTDTSGASEPPKADDSLTIPALAAPRTAKRER